MTDKPQARLREEPWHDEVYDAIALVEAVLRDDLDGVRAVLHGMEPGPVVVALAKICAELAAAGERDIMPCRCHFRQFALLVVDLP